MELRTCSICGNELPLDRDHFRYRVKDGNPYFSAECQHCIKQEKRKAAKRAKAKRKESLSRIEKAGVDLFTSSAGTGGNNIPHSAELLERVFGYFGGVSGFSSVLVKQYYDSPAGGSARNRIIETLCRLVVKNVESGGAKKPLQLWTEEELEAELDKRFEEAVSSFKGKTINVQAQQPKAIEATSSESIAANLEAAQRLAERIPEAGVERPAERASGEEAGSTEALQAEPEPREDS